MFLFLLSLTASHVRLLFSYCLLFAKCFITLLGKSEHFGILRWIIDLDVDNVRVEQRQVGFSQGKVCEFDVASIVASVELKGELSPLAALVV